MLNSVNIIAMLLIISSLVTQIATAELIVIGGDDQGIDAAKYLKSKGQTAYKYSGQNTHQQLRSISIAETYYPVQSNLSSGIVKKHKIDPKFKALPAVFIVGDDTKSLKWLDENQEYLKEIGAIGVITNVSNQQTVERLIGKYNLVLMPASLEKMDEKLGLNHYPALVYKGWVVQ